MTIEIKEIIVKTTVSDEKKTAQADQSAYNKLKREILDELKREQRKNERHKKER